MNKKNIIIINSVVSIIIIALVLYLVGAEEVLVQIGKIDLFYLILSVVFLFFMDMGMAYRIRVLLTSMGVNLPFFHIIKSHFVGMFLADFTPARSGYLATAGVLHYKYGLPSEKAMVSILGPQIFDFALKLVAGTISIFYIVYYFLKPEDSFSLLIGFPLISLVIAVMLLGLFSKRFLNFFSFTKQFPVLRSIFALTERMQQNSHVVVSKSIEITVLMLITWSFKSISWYFVAKAVGINLSTGYPELLFYFFLQPLLTMLEFIPSPTIAGLGLSEGGSALIFSLFGIPPFQATAFALIARFKTTLLHLPAIPEVLDTLKKQDLELSKP